MAIISIGPGAYERDNMQASFKSFIALGNPSNANGVINTIRIFANTNIAGAKIGTFSFVSGTTYKCRDVAIIGDVVSGSAQIFPGLSLSVNVGDYLGIYFSSGDIENSSSGFAGIRYAFGDILTVDLESSTSSFLGQAISIHGAGTVIRHHFINFQGPGVP